MAGSITIKCFDLADLIGRRLEVRSFKDDHVELIIAFDIKTGDVFVLKEIHHPGQG